MNVVSQIPLTPKLEGKIHIFFSCCNELYSLSKHQPGLGDLKFYEKTNGSVSVELIYGQTNGSTGVLCMWGEDAGALIKPQNLDVPGFCCLLFGLPGWTVFHVSSSSCFAARVAAAGSFSNYLLLKTAN